MRHYWISRDYFALTDRQPLLLLGKYTGSPDQSR